MIALRKPLLLASSSPRRQYLMKEVGFTFEVAHPDIDESFPDNIPYEDVPSYLARKKSQALLPQQRDKIILASDTVVILKHKILNKPQDRNEAIEMLSSLSDNTHIVITAVCLLSNEKEDCFDDRTEVTFSKISQREIEYYVDNYKPFDKAGSYGAQDWIGLTAIEKINGSYFTVMGLPMHKVYERLKVF